jgi:hypothetical protein
MFTGRAVCYSYVCVSHGPSHRVSSQPNHKGRGFRPALLGAYFLAPRDSEKSRRCVGVGRELGISDRVIDAIQGHAGRVAADDYGDVTMVTRIRAIDQFPHYALGTDEISPSTNA